MNFLELKEKHMLFKCWKNFTHQMMLFFLNVLFKLFKNNKTVVDNILEKLSFDTDKRGCCTEND